MTETFHKNNKSFCYDRNFLQIHVKFSLYRKLFQITDRVNRDHFPSKRGDLRAGMKQEAECAVISTGLIGRDDNRFL